MAPQQGDYPSAPVPADPGLGNLRAALERCRACDLWEPATQRIHQRPDRWQVKACLPWLSAELELVQPEALVCLGATAAQGLLGSQIRMRLVAESLTAG
jgi:uracil-DNA glycosylase